MKLNHNESVVIVILAGNADIHSSRKTSFLGISSFSEFLCLQIHFWQVNCGFSEVRPRPHSIRSSSDTDDDSPFPNMSRTVIQQIDAPVPPLMVHLQRIQSDLNENGSLELVNIECWSDGIYKCSDEFTIIDRIKLNEA